MIGFIHKIKQIAFFPLFIAGVLFFASPAESSDIIIIADTQLKPVKDVVNSIERVLSYSAKVYLPAGNEGSLKAIVREENARVVIALGKEALGLALGLPESIPVIYGMIIAPPKNHRQNITGIYLETPVQEYLAFVNKYFASIKKIGVVYGHDSERLMKSVESPQIKAVKARNSYEFANAAGLLNVDALLLLPDRQLLTPAAVESVYLLSFRSNIPILGISEKYVKEGGLFALVFDTVNMGRQLAEMAKNVLANGNAYVIEPSPPEKFNLYINTDTARKMNIYVPDETLRKAKKLYP